MHDTVGIDLVAMCVNDIIVQGAEPLFFLDYFATGKLDVDTAASVIAGIGKGCELAGAALVGGETAEMPGMYADGEYDLAGFCVGIVEKSKVLDGSKVKIGDKLIGIASSGPHSNGYSLIRKIIARSQASLSDDFQGIPLGAALLEPTRIYVKSLLSLLEKIDVHALAHITGGGLTENLPRVLPEGLDARIDLSAWQFPAIFQWLQQQGNVSQADMLTTFNCGIGMIVCVAAEDEEATLETLASLGETVFAIGELVASEGKAESRLYLNRGDRLCEKNHMVPVGPDSSGPKYRPLSRLDSLDDRPSSLALPTEHNASNRKPACLITFIRLLFAVKNTVSIDIMRMPQQHHDNRCHGQGQQYSQKAKQLPARYDGEDNSHRMQADFIADQQRRQHHAFQSLANREHNSDRNQIHRILKLHQAATQAMTMPTIAPRYGTKLTSPATMPINKARSSPIIHSPIL